MKIFKNTAKVLIAVFSFAVISCEEPIDLSVENRDVRFLVVEGQISSDTMAHAVTLTWSGNFYLDNPTPRATGANVSIRDDNGSVIHLSEQQPGVYKTAEDVYGMPGHTYTLVIELDNQTYESSSTMPRPVYMDSLSYRWDPYMQRYRILLYGQEPEGKGDNYTWHIWRNGQLTTSKVSQLLLTADEIFDGRYIMGFEVDWFTNDHNIGKGDTILVGQHTLTREALDYKYRITEQSNGGMGMGSPANVPSQISNGAKGLFHATSVTYKSVILE